MSPTILRISIVALLLTSAALAQGAATSTDYGVLATNGTANGFNSRALGTPVGTGLGVHATAGGATNRTPDAFASTGVLPAATDAGRGVQIHEEGGAHGATATASAAAGTSASAPGTASPTQGAHGIALAFPVASGVNGTVTIVWDVRATAGASIGGAVDVDGDGVADWTGSAAHSDHVALPVVAGANGVHVQVLTDGHAAVQGIGGASYGATLTVVYHDGTGGVTCTWTAHGPQCLGQLTGVDLHNRDSLGVQLTVANAAASGIGVLGVGQALASPLNLPVGTCQLLVDPATAHLFVFTTDASGGAVLRFNMRAQALVVEMQAVTLGFASGVLGSTNALNLTCQ